MDGPSHRGSHRFLLVALVVFPAQSTLKQPQISVEGPLSTLKAFNFAEAYLAKFEILAIQLYAAHPCMKVFCSSM